MLLRAAPHDTSLPSTQLLFTADKTDKTLPEDSQILNGRWNPREDERLQADTVQSLDSRGDSEQVGYQPSQTLKIQPLTQTGESFHQASFSYGSRTILHSFSFLSHKLHS